LNIEEYILSGILEAYALGELSAAERSAVEKDLAQYPELRRELALVEEVQEELLLKSAIKPRASVKAELLTKISFEKPEAKVVSMPSSAWKYATAASIVLALITSYMAYEYYGRWQSSEKNLTTIIAQNRQMAQDYNTVNERLDKIESDLRVTDNPAFTRIVMKNPDPSVTAMASVYWNEKTKEVYLSIQDMKQLAQENQYQLWAMIDGKPVNAGVFDVGPNGLIKMKNMAGAATFAVTIESRGGKPTPNLKNLQVIGNVVKG
jgi:anti-sigma-K factor RskA